MQGNNTNQLENKELEEAIKNEIEKMLQQSDVKISLFRKENPSRFLEIKEYIQKLEISLQEGITDEVQTIFSTIKDIWLDGLPHNGLYLRSMFKGMYSETELLFDKEKSILCQIRDLNRNQEETFENLLKTDFKNTMCKIFESAKTHTNSLPFFMKKLFSNDSNGFSDGIVFSYLLGYYFMPSISDPVISDIEIYGYMKNFCSILQIDNELEKININVLNSDDFSQFKEKWNNVDLFNKMIPGLIDSIRKSITENVLDESILLQLLSVVEELFEHDYSDALGDFIELLYKNLFEALSMDIRNDVL